MNKVVQFTILAAVLGLIGCQSLKDRMDSAKVEEKQEKVDTKASKPSPAPKMGQKQ